MATFRIETSTDIQDRYVGLRDQLRELGRSDLKRRINRKIKLTGEPALAAVRAATLRIDVKSSAGGSGSTGLRRRVAAALKISTLPSGISIGVSGKKVDPRYGRSLSYLLNGQGTWRHPVFGTDTIVEQTGEDAFFGTLDAYRPRWRAAIEQAMDEAARELG